jgi:predicted PurR-regulated permease PerM
MKNIINNRTAKQAFIERATYLLLFLILIIYSLQAAREFLYPIAIAFLLSYLLYPIAHFLERKLKFPRIAAILLTILIAISILYGGIALIVHQIKSLISDFDVLKDKAMINVDIFQDFIADRFGVSNSSQKIWIKKQLALLFKSGNKFLSNLISTTTGTIISILILPVYTFFMLFYRNKARVFFLRLAENRHSNITEALLNQISKVTIRYITGVANVVLILVVINTIGLSIIGIEYAIMLGIISSLFAFIPYFGSAVGGIIPFSFALLTGSSPHEALIVVIFYIVVMITDHNIITPNIVGNNVRLNPFIVIISIIGGGMVWGIPGMIVIVPLIAIFKIICDKVESLKVFGYLLGAEGTEEHGITWAKIKSWFRKSKT